jgi:tetratricopeptide (TPR) repeat protein
MGMVFLRLKKYDDAIRAFDTAVELNPGHAEAWYAGAVVHALKGDMDKALDGLSKAVGLEPKLKKKTRAEKAFKPLWHHNDFNLLIE